MEFSEDLIRINNTLFSFLSNSTISDRLTVQGINGMISMISVISILLYKIH